MRNLKILTGAVFTAALLTLSTTTASAQICASLFLTTQAEVDAVSCMTLFRKSGHLVSYAAQAPAP